MKSETKQIWSEDEVLTGAEYDDIDDQRTQPESVIHVHPH